MRAPPNQRVYGYVVVMLVFFIFAHYLGWSEPIERSLRSLVVPLLSRTSPTSAAVMNVSGDRPLRPFPVGSSTTEVNLRTQIQLLEEENEKLRQLLNFQKKYRGALVGAEIISREIQNLDQLFIINRGSLAGVTANDPVIVGEGILIGSVVKTEPDIAFIRLITDNQSKIAATVLNRERSLGIVEGGFGISLRLKFVPRTETIIIGEAVVTSGLEEMMPRGLLIGTVSAVENEAYQPFQQAVIVPAYDVQKATSVSVITKQ